MKKIYTETRNFANAFKTCYDLITVKPLIDHLDLLRLLSMTDQVDLLWLTVLYTLPLHVLTVEQMTCHQDFLLPIVKQVIHVL